jgi:hypothetical protein
MQKKFEQIQYAAIVEYSSPLVGPKSVIGLFHKQSWELIYHVNGVKHTIKVTPSQTCIQLEHPLALLNDKYMGFYADLSKSKEKENSEW